MKKIHKVSVLVLLPNNHILLHFRDDNTPSCPLSFSSWGGVIENHEKPEDAAIREMDEELGVTVSPSELEFQYERLEGGIVFHVFLLQKNLQLKELCLNEGGGFISIPLKSVTSVPLCPNMVVDLKNTNLI